MNVIREILGRTTQQALFGGGIIATACVLALRGDIGGEVFLGLALAVVAVVFPRTGDSA